MKGSVVLKQDGARFTRDRIKDTTTWAWEDFVKLFRFYTASKLFLGRFV